MSLRPVVCLFVAEDYSFVISPRDRATAAKQFADGQQYPLEVREERSSKQHNHYFASVNNAWTNLRGESAQILNTPKKLRQWALIQTGWHDQSVSELETRRDAIISAAFIRRLSTEDEYFEIAVRSVKDEKGGASHHNVIVKRAKTQSLLMKNEDFKASSRDVLELLANEINVTRRELEQSAGDTA